MSRLLYVALALVIASAMASTYSPSVPCFFWAGQSYFADHANVGDVLSASDLSGILKQLTSQSGASSRWVSESGAGAPEVVVAFINQQLSSGGGSQASGAYSAALRPSALKAALAGSVSSLSVPFVTLNGQRSSEVLADAFNQATVVEITLESSCEGVVDAAIARAELFTNGVADLIVVNSADSAATEACLNAVTSAVNTATSGRYVALLTGDVSSTRSVPRSFGLAAAARPSFATSSLLQASAAAEHDSRKVRTLDSVSATVIYTGPQYITGTIVVGLLIVGGLLAVMIMGVCMTLNIEAPLRFAGPTQKLVIGKEH